MKLINISKKKLAVITTNPQTYQVRIFEKISKTKIFNLDVYYASSEGATVSKYNEFNKIIKPDVSLKKHNHFISEKQNKNISSFFLSFYNLKEFLIKKKYDAILIFGWNNMFYLKSFFIGIFHKIPLILRVETNHNRNIFFIKKTIKNIILYFFLKKFKYFLYIGKKNKKFYKSFGIKNNKLFNAPYSVDNEFFFRKNNNLKFLKKKFKLSKKKIILFVGKLIDRKNPQVFLQLALSFKDNKDLLFILVGDGDLMSYCKNYVLNNKLNNVRLFGFKYRYEIKDLYKISYLLVMPSKYETWGLVVNEAMASKLPALVSDACGCSNDLIKDHLTGFVYKEGSFLDLKKKFTKIVENKDLHLRIKSNLIPYIKRQNFDFTINSLIKILCRI
jgi:glycosyltransferase involved in cell wall biosynthesis